MGGLGAVHFASGYNLTGESQSVGQASQAKAPAGTILFCS